MRGKPSYKVVVFASGQDSPETAVRLGQLVERLRAQVPGAGVCAILFELPTPKSFSNRLRNFLRQLGDTHFPAYVVHRVFARIKRLLSSAGSSLLRLAHAMPQPKPTRRWLDLESMCRELDCQLMITRDMHNPASLNFVRSLSADLGLLYGTRVLKPSLFEIPSEGSINIHKRKVPDYRGGGPVGLWELLDGESEIGITVHRVVARLDAGEIVREARIPIQQFDTLETLSIKADVVGDDLIVDSIRDYANGAVTLRSQGIGGRTFRSPRPHVLLSHEKRLRAGRAAFKSHRGRPMWKLLLRSLVGLPYAAARNWHRRVHRSFPIVILFHHLVADRFHPMGSSTESFLRHIEFLRNHYRVISLREALQLIDAGEVTEPTVVLTFDDGYNDNWLNLRAIAARTGIPATLFISTDYMENAGEFPHDVEAGRHGFSALTWPQVQALHRSGFEVGSHTCSHFDCGSADIDLLRHEIADSKAAIEQHLGESVSTFSFPFGLAENMSPEACAIAKENYRYVFSACGGVNPPGMPNSQERTLLLRCPHSSNLWELELSIQSLLDFGSPHAQSDQRGDAAYDAVRVESKG